MSQQQGYTYMNVGSQHYVDPDSIPLSVKNSWCTYQMNTCSQLCGPVVYNSCDPNALDCSCTCANTPTPNVTAYLYTLPSFACFQWQIDCLSNVTDISSPLFNACRAVQCGTLDAAIATSPVFPTSAPGIGSGATQDSQQLSPNARAGLVAGLGVAALFSMTAIVLMWFWHRRRPVAAIPSRDDSSLETQINLRPLSSATEMGMRRQSVNGLNLTTLKKPLVAAADVAESPGGSPTLPGGFGHGHGDPDGSGRGSDVSRHGRPMSPRKSEGRKLENRESRLAMQTAESMS